MKMNKIQSYVEPPVSAMERWKPGIRSAAEDGNTLNILGVIGMDLYSDDGTTAQDVAQFLAKRDGADVTLNLNSPGGDFFDGLAIYNMLKEYEGNVKIKVLGIAASAASVIAMAGDEIEIAKNGFFMIHNSWSVAIGNKHDMRERADMLAEFDKSMQGLYADITGIDEDEIETMMDEETWIDGKSSVDMGFAMSLLGEDLEEIEEDEGANALRITDLLLAKAGVQRKDRRELLNGIKGTQDAANATQDAGPSDVEVLKKLTQILKSQN